MSEEPPYLLRCDTRDREFQQDNSRIPADIRRFQLSAGATADSSQKKNCLDKGTERADGRKRYF